jgi:hypothetical protein
VRRVWAAVKRRYEKRLFKYWEKKPKDASSHEWLGE